jgi:MraZ protein
MVLAGTYNRTLDDKNRLSLPKRVRERLGLGAKESLFVLVSPRPCLLLYTLADLNHLGSVWEAKSASYEEAVARYLDFFPDAEEVTVDREGRILLSEAMMTGADLGRDVVMLGVKDHLQVWNRDRWAQHRATRSRPAWLGGIQALQTGSGDVGGTSEEGKSSS